MRRTIRRSRSVATEILMAAAQLLIACVGTFLLVHLAPQRPELYVLGQGASPSAVEALHRTLGLDRPTVVQLVEWLARAARGDFGDSYVTGLPVFRTVLTAAGPTVSIVVVGAIVALATGVTAGTLAALHQGTWVDRVLGTGVGLFQAVPGFWLGIVLVTVFALGLGVLPATGYAPPQTSISGWARSIVLPGIALGIPAGAVLARQLRSSLLGQLGQEYVRVAVAQGFSRWYVTTHHALRNALGPVLSVAGFQVVVMLSTAVVVEGVFGIDGLGSLAVRSTVQGDIPTLMGAVVLFTFTVLLVNVLVRGASRALNPRLRAG